MSNLEQLQKNFQEYLLNENKAVLPVINHADRDSNVERMQIYYNAYRWRLIDVLYEYYPKIHCLLGADIFCEIAEGYIDNYPSTTKNLNRFGQKFSKYLSENYQESSILSEMAEFEWALHTTFTKPDKPFVTVQNLSEIPAESWPNMVLVPHPVLSTIEFNLNTETVWKSLHQFPEEHVTIIKLKQPETIAFWRREYQTYFKSLTENEHVVLEGILAKNNFANICESLLSVLDEQEIPEFALTQIQSWLNEKCIFKIQL